MPSTRGSDHRRALLAALLVTILWSSSWVLIRWGLDDEALDPLTFAGLRYAVAAVVIATWTMSRRHARQSLLRIDRRTFVRTALLGLVFYTLTQGAQFVAIDNQPAATTSLVLSWTPLLVALVARRAIDEPVTVSQLVGALVVAAGAAVYFQGELGATGLGMTAALVGLAAGVTGSILGRSINRTGDLSPAAVTSVSMGVGATLLFAVGIATEGLPSVSLRAWLIIGWLAVVNTALAFTLWNFSLRRLSALESAGINNTMLIQIAALAWLFLDEPLGGRELAGIALVSAGVLLTQARFGQKVSSWR